VAEQPRVDELKFEVLDAETVFSGFLTVARHRLRHESFRGGWCAPMVRERVEGLRAVAVLPYDPVQDSVVLIEQFRVGALEDPAGAWLLEIVGGYWAPDEEAVDVARRECLEEAGCRLGELVEIGGFYVSPGVSSERVELYCGRVEAPPRGGIHGLAEEGEEMRVVVLPMARVAEELFGRINSTTAIITLQWLLAQRAALRRRWGVT
jgi:ADP-ribose pyrophosphatase